MSALTRFARFWYDFVVGDDWRLACGAGVALGGTAVLAAIGVPAWWFAPVVVAGLLSVMVWTGIG